MELIGVATVEWIVGQHIGGLRVMSVAAVIRKVG
jgi:hypothetical protein